MFGNGAITSPCVPIQPAETGGTLVQPYVIPEHNELCLAGGSELEGGPSDEPSRRSN